MILAENHYKTKRNLSSDYYRWRDRIQNGRMLNQQRTEAATPLPLGRCEHCDRQHVQCGGMPRCPKCEREQIIAACDHLARKGGAK